MAGWRVKVVEVSLLLELKVFFTEPIKSDTRIEKRVENISRVHFTITWSLIFK